MTVTTQTSTASYYGNGSTVAFAVPFYFLANTHLQVILRDAEGIETVKTLTTDYSVTGAGVSSGGTVTMVTAPASGQTLVIKRNVPITQETDYQENDPFPAATHEMALDKLTMIVQQQDGELDNALHFPASETTNDGELPSAADRAGKYLGFDGNGNPIVSDIIPDSRYYGALAADPSTRPNGSAMVAGDAYYNTTYQSLRIYSGSAWSAAPYVADGTSLRTGTATAGQTAFTVTGGYTAGKIQVYINGVLLAPADYTATNGTTITFTAALAASDEIAVVVFKSVGSVSVNDVTGITFSNSAPSGSAVDGSFWFQV